MTVSDDQEPIATAAVETDVDRVELAVPPQAQLPFKPRTPDRALGFSFLLSLAVHGGIVAVIAWACFAVVPPSAAIMMGDGGPGGRGAVVTWHDESAGTANGAMVETLADRLPGAAEAMESQTPVDIKSPEVETTSALDDSIDRQTQMIPLMADPLPVIFSSWMNASPRWKSAGPAMLGGVASGHVEKSDGAAGGSGGSGALGNDVAGRSGGTGGGQAASVAGGVDGDGNGGDGLVGGAPVPGAHNRPPRYPAEARQKGMEGTVVLEMEIQSDGRVASVKVATSSGYELLDRAAVDGVKHWQFTPARSNGTAMGWLITQPVEFHLNR